MSEISILNQKLAHSLSYYDIDTGRELHRTRFSDYRHECAVDSKNGYASIGPYGIETHMQQSEGGNEIFVVDIAEAKHVRTLSVWPFRRVHGLVVDEQDRLYALSGGTRPCSSPTSRTNRTSRTGRFRQAATRATSLRSARTVRTPFARTCSAAP